MKVLYISNYVDKNYFDKIFNNAEEKPIQSIQKFNEMFTEGLIKQSDVDEVDVISTAPVNRKISRKYFWKGEKKLQSGISFSYVPFINIKILKQIVLFLCSFFMALSWCIKNIKKEKVLVFDGFFPIVSTTFVLWCSFFNIMVIGLYTDVPKCMNHNIKKQNLFHKLTKFIVNIGDYINRNLSDAYILLTEEMNSVINNKAKPFIIMEGMVDLKTLSSVKSKSRKVIMYAGGLYETYGVKTLIEAFNKWNNENYELWLCGDGDLVDYIKSYNNNHIKFFGSLPNKKVVEMEKKASLLVNPRFTNGEYTKYSFPSKTLEYMLSGTPVLTTRLSGIPSEYDNYINYIDDESVDGIYKCLCDLLDKDNEKALSEKASKAKAFVSKKKNNVAQLKRIVSFVKKIMNQKKVKDYVVLLEKISLIVITVTSILPNLSNRYVFGLFMLLWIISSIPTLINSNYAIVKNTKVFIASAILMGALLIINYFFGRYNLLFSYLFSNIRLLCIIVVGLFYAVYEENRKKIARSFYIIIIVVMCYSCLKTGIYNIMYYNVSRMLSTGISQTGYRFTGIIGLGSYHYIYGIIYPIFIFMIYIIEKLKKKKYGFNFWVVLITFTISLFCLIKAEFMYSYILLVVAILLYIFKINNVKRIVVCLLGMILILCVIRMPLANFLDTCANKINSPNIQLRFKDVASMLRGNVDDTTDVKARLENYYTSINTFTNEPIIGVGYNKDDNRIGSHSTLLDVLAKFGIIGGIVFITLIMSSIVCIYRKIGVEYKDIVFYCSTIFLLFMLINNALLVPIFYFFYIVVPFISYYLEVKNESFMGR